jgi:hypothetical protein
MKDWIVRLRGETMWAHGDALYVVRDGGGEA